MQVDQLVLGAFETNCYVLRESGGATGCVVVDAGLDAGRLVGFLQQRKLNAVALVLTHGHADHIAGVVELRKNFVSLKVYIHQLDAEMLTGEQDNLSLLAGGTFRADAADFLVVESDKIEQAGISLEVLHTPGHTRGGISLYCRDEGVVFAGDTLFAGSVGRTDFPGGSMRQLIKSIRERLLVLPDQTTVYPGHGPATTIAQEKAYNPFVS
ncbi:MAG: MBL fold metallo-hydrolase [Planctomycetota bacterium]|jgi:glyoxylase-like metal-dependent hydrolase (beta-lactamase superfamily II)